jgi:hypothetical protein
VTHGPCKALQAHVGMLRCAGVCLADTQTLCVLVAAERGGLHTSALAAHSCHHLQIAVHSCIQLRCISRATVSL